MLAAGVRGVGVRVRVCVTGAGIRGGRGYVVIVRVAVKRIAVGLVLFVVIVFVVMRVCSVPVTMPVRGLRPERRRVPVHAARRVIVIGPVPQQVHARQPQHEGQVREQKDRGTRAGARLACARVPCAPHHALHTIRPSPRPGSRRARGWLRMPGACGCPPAAPRKRPTMTQLAGRQRGVPGGSGARCSGPPSSRKTLRKDSISMRMLASLSIVTLLALPGLAAAEGLLDMAKSAAGQVGKVAGNKGVDAVKKAAGPALTGKLEKEVNKRLMDEAAKNQCTFKTDSDQFEGSCDSKAQKLATTVIDAKKKLEGAGLHGFKFEVSGHTDSRGDAAHNKELSQRRAQVMVRELISRGVPAEQINAVGFGAERPLVKPDNTAAKQARNRRYELRVRL